MQVTDDGLEGSRRRVRSIALSAVLVLLLATAWAVTEPEALREGSGSTVGAPVPVGGSLFVGQLQLGDRDVVLERVEPVVLAGLQATAWLCRPLPGALPLGVVGADDIGDHCELASVTPGTLLPGTAGDPSLVATSDYLVVELTSTARAPQVFCGLDVTYRDGWRTARQRQVATQQAITNAPDEDDDDAGEDPLRLVEDCPHQRAD